MTFAELLRRLHTATSEADHHVVPTPTDLEADPACWGRFLAAFERAERGNRALNMIEAVRQPPPPPAALSFTHTVYLREVKAGTANVQRMYDEHQRRQAQTAYLEPLADHPGMKDPPVVEW